MLPLASQTPASEVPMVEGSTLGTPLSRGARTTAARESGSGRRSGGGWARASTAPGEMPRLRTMVPWRWMFPGATEAQGAAMRAAVLLAAAACSCPEDKGTCPLPTPPPPIPPLAPPLSCGFPPSPPGSGAAAAGRAVAGEGDKSMGEKGTSDSREKSEGLIRAAAQKASSLHTATRPHIPLRQAQESPRRDPFRI